jgi:predicted metal-dependent hydrolase
VDSPAPRQAPSSQPAPPVEEPASPRTVLADGKRRIQLKEHVLEYSLRRSKRRSIGFLISDGGLRISAPKWVTLGEIENAIREKQRWIFNKLNEQRERSARQLQPQMQWRDGATFPYLGESITLRIASDSNAGIAYDSTSRALTVCLPADAGEQQLKDRVQAWLQLEAKRVFAERLPVYAEKLGVTYQSFSLTSAMTQWGSCTADGKIRLNWRLMHFALPQIDYVIAHELSHLREMNHSPRFWATVQSVFPEFEEAKKALRDGAPETLPIF